MSVLHFREIFSSENNHVYSICTYTLRDWYKDSIWFWRLRRLQCTHLIHIKILKINLDRLCFRLHDGSNDGTWVDLKGGGVSGNIPFCRSMNYKNNISSKIEKVPRGIQGYGHIIKNVSSKSNVWMDPFKDWLHIWIQQNLIQCVFTNVLNYGTKYASW